MDEISSAERVMRARLAWIIAGIAVVVLVLRFWPEMTVLDRMELRTVDWRFTQCGPREPHPRIVIVDVDEASIAQIGRWPWPRERFAEVIRTLADAGAAAIVFDIFFADPDTGPGGERSDLELVRATREAGNVFHAAFGHAPRPDSTGDASVALEARSWSGSRVLEGRGLSAIADIFELGEVTSPLPGLVEAAAGVGFVNVVDSGDGVYRHTFPVVRHGGQIYPSLSLAAAAGVLDIDPAQVVVRPGREVDLAGRRRVPMDRLGRTLIDFAGGAETYPYLPVHELLAMAADDPEIARWQFDGRIVLVAVSAPGLYDLRASPFSTVYNGVETQANALANILEGRFLREAPGEWCVFAVIALAVAMFFGLSRLRPTWAVIFAAAVILGFNWLALMLFARGLVVTMVAPNLVLLGSIITALALRLMGEESEHERVWGALSRFVPAAVIERAVEEDPSALLRGQRRVVSVVFADIRDFTAKSEQMDPEQTVELLNRFFYLVHETIWEFDGTLDKYLGDGLMAFWNSPTSQPDHALLAVQAAVHMRRRIEYNQAEWEFLGMPELSAGIGISTGEAVVGYVGTGERMQYTAIGAHVNLAARLEGMTKEFGASILISEATYEQVGHAVETRALGPVEVRGFAEPVGVYEVIDLKGG